MKVGITGHQERDGIDWIWVRSKINECLDVIHVPLDGYTSLAAGADQVFAQSLLDHHGRLNAVIPLANYESYFNASNLTTYREFLECSKRINLAGSADDAQEAFYSAGIYIANASDMMIAVWDEQTARGHGGTADIVGYCRSKDIPITIINPITHRVIGAGQTEKVASGFPKKQ